MLFTSSFAVSTVVLIAALEASVVEARRFLSLPRILIQSPTTIFPKNGAFPNHDRRTQDVCAADDVFADDDESLTIFAPSYQPICSCDEANSFDTFLQNTPFPEEATDINEVNAYLEQFNAAAADIDFKETTICENSCTLCFEGFCGILATDETTSFQGRYTRNFTLADLVELGTADDGMVEDVLLDRIAIYTAGYADTTCFDVIQGVDEPAEICFSLEFVFSAADNDSSINIDQIDQALQGSDASCTVSYDDAECTSCNLDFTTGCISMDCTNVQDNAMLDSCTSAPEDFPGAFRAMYILQAEIATTEFSSGTCDVISIPVASPTNAPVVPPTAFPVVSPSTASPMVAPTMTTSPPMAAPTSMTTAPVTVPTMTPPGVDPVSTDSAAVPSTFMVAGIASVMGILGLM